MRGLFPSLGTLICGLHQFQHQRLRFLGHPSAFYDRSADRVWLRAGESGSETRVAREEDIE